MVINRICTPFIFLVVFGVQSVTGQSINPGDIRMLPAPSPDRICTLDPTDVNAHFSLRAAHDPALFPDIVPQADFEITYVNSCGANTWPDEAIDAFEYAADIWATHIRSNVPIRVEAIWENIGPLGSAGPTFIIHSSNIIGGIPDTWYPIAQANAMAGFDFLATDPDEEFHIEIRMDCGTNNWYFFTDANPGPNQIDFATVVLHEFGHGLGFIGTLEADQGEQEAEWGIQGSNNGDVYPIIYDRLAVDGDDFSLLNENIYPNPSVALYEAATGRRNGLFLTGFDINRMYAGLPAPVYAPLAWSSGSSYSHLDDETFRNTENALMRPRMDQAFAIHTPGPVFCGILSDTGWPLGSNCLIFLDREVLIAVEPDTLDFAVVNIGTTSEKVITIRNEAGSEGTITGMAEIEESGFAIVPASRQFDVEPGESHDVIVRFAPSVTGDHEGVVTVFHNAVNELSPIEITVLGEGIERDVLAVLDQNYPNPFQHSTTIPYALPGESDVRIDIFNVTGQLVSTIVNTRLPPGRDKIIFDSHGLSSGTYFYRIYVDGFAEVKKMMLVR